MFFFLLFSLFGSVWRDSTAGKVLALNLALRFYPQQHERPASIELSVAMIMCLEVIPAGAQVSMLYMPLVTCNTSIHIYTYIEQTYITYIDMYIYIYMNMNMYINSYIFTHLYTRIV